jgi:GT2 family glycosyltransferase
MLDLSIIIVNWNTKENLKECLDSLHVKKLDFSFEVIVVDNASSDGSGKMVSKRYPQVLLLANEENVGFSRANNQAIELCRGRYVLLLNPDTVVLGSCLERMLDFMEKHPEAGAAGCKILNTRGELEPFRSAKRFPTPLTKFFVDLQWDRLFPRIRLFGQYSMMDWDRSEEKEIDVLSGAFMFVRKKIIQEVGLLDESFFLLAEDIDWCRRIKQGNWKILFNPDAEIIHHSGKAIDQVVSTRLKNAIFSHLLYFEKHNRRIDPIVFRFLQSITHLFKTIFWLYKFMLGPDKKSALERLRAHFKAIFYCFCVRTGYLG